VLASILAGHRDSAPLVSPLAADMESLAAYSWKPFRRLVVLLLGASVLVVGIAMIVLPGPAIIVIPAGVAILGTEFLWVRQLLSKMKRTGGTMLQRKPSRRKTRPNEPAADHRGEGEE
jgi:tellurite resistance protein TerC